MRLRSLARCDFGRSREPRGQTSFPSTQPVQLRSALHTAALALHTTAAARALPAMPYGLHCPYEYELCRHEPLHVGVGIHVDKSGFAIELSFTRRHGRDYQKSLNLYDFKCLDRFMDTIEVGHTISFYGAATCAQFKMVKLQRNTVIWKENLQWILHTIQTEVSVLLNQ